MSHGKQLEQKLKELGIKKKELAERLAVHPNTITLWLGKDILEPSVKQRIADSLDLAESSIFYSAQIKSLTINEPEFVYGEVSVHSKPLKKLDAFQYCGLLGIKEDGLELQRKWRGEW